MSDRPGSRSIPRRSSKLALAVFISAISILAGGVAAAAEGTTVYLVRHAEKATVPADDPVLTSTGQRRAQKLADMLATANVTAVHASQFRRTQLTVEPLAEKLGVDVEVLDAGNLEGNARHLIDEHAGETVVIAGHSNTVPDLVTALGGQPDGAIDESDYDNLYVVVIASNGETTTLHLQYTAD